MFPIARPLSGLLCMLSLTKQLFLSSAVVMTSQALSVILLLLYNI